MSKVVLYIAESIDGFIADKDGKVDWLEKLPNPDNTDYGYGKLLDSIDTIIMGRNTYESLLGFDIEWPYSDFKTFIITSNKDFKSTTANTVVISEDIDKNLLKIKQQATKNIWLVGGGLLINYFLNKQLIDRIILAIAPLTLGSGTPLFPGVTLAENWEMTQVEHFNSGIIIITYDKN